MGNHQTNFATYAVPVKGTEKPGSTAIYRAASHPSALVESLLDEKVTNCWDIFQLGVKKAGDAPYLGTRQRLADGKLGDYTWKSYTEVELLAKQCGSGLLRTRCMPTVSFPDELVNQCRELRMLGLYSKNREEWFIVEQAANAYNLTVVPLYDTLGLEALKYILRHTELSTVVATSESVHNLLVVAEGSKLQTIIALDDFDEATREKIKAAGVRVVDWSELLRAGQEELMPIAPGTLDDVGTICYTSGTTGQPKGIIQTHRNFVSVVCAAIRGPLSYNEVSLSNEDVHLSYLPLAHVLERIVCIALSCCGARLGMYGGDTLKLLDDIQALQPTVFFSVPRLYSRINDKIFSNLEDKSSLVQYLFGAALRSKLKRLRKNGCPSHPLWDALLFNKTKSLMGSRMRYMVVGGAPLSATVQERMSCLFCCPFLEGYGMTESMGGSFITHPRDPAKGSVGGVVAAVEFKLQSVPEMDYCVDDCPPRGELCVRGPACTPGYFRNPEETKKALDGDGWLHTGDVGMLLPTAAVKIIDRAKNMFKLSQGEYVAPEKVEQVYQQACLVAQVFCFGYSSKAFLVGIVVPDGETAAKWAAKHGLAGSSLEQLCESPEFKKTVEDEGEQVAKAQGLKGFEKLKAFKLHHIPFSVDNDLLTPTFKLRRHQAKNHFQKDIDSMYDQLGE